MYVKSILCHAAGTGVNTATAQVYFCPVGVSSASTNKIFDVDVSAGETVLLEPSYPLVLDTTGDSLQVGTGNYTGIAATHVNFLITGDKEDDTCISLKSSLARTAAKLLGVNKDADLSLRGATQSSRVLPPEVFSATGGTKIPSGDYTYHVWTTGTPAPLSVFDVTEGSRSLDVLLVGGGGGGGANNSGGGGAGGMVYGTGVITATDGMSNVPITIGGAGSGGPASPEGPGTLGGDTIFGSSPNPYYLVASGGASGQWTQDSNKMLLVVEQVVLVLVVPVIEVHQHHIHFQDLQLNQHNQVILELMVLVTLEGMVFVPPLMVVAAEAVVQVVMVEILLLQMDHLRWNWRSRNDTSRISCTDSCTRNTFTKPHCMD